jgi:hypothetical protein
MGKDSNTCVEWGPVTLICHSETRYFSLTGKIGKTATVHIFDLKTNRDISISDIPETFGWRLDPNADTNGNYFEAAISVSTNEVMILQQIYQVTKKVQLNLNNRQFTLSRTVGKLSH